MVTKFAVNILNNIELNILEFGFLKGDKNWNFKNHTAPFNKLYFVTKGTGYLKNSDYSYKLSPGNIYMIPAGSTLDYSCEDDFEKYYLHFSYSNSFGVDFFGNTGEIRQYKSEYPIDFKHFENTHSILLLTKLKSLIYDILCSFIPDDIDINTNFYKYIDVINKIESNLSSNMNLKQIFNCDFYELSRKFKKDTGINLKTQIQSMLIQKIKEDLVTSDLSIKEISYKYQFCDPYYLSKFFKKAEGCSPKEYRKNNTF